MCLKWCMDSVLIQFAHPGRVYRGAPALAGIGAVRLTADDFNWVMSQGPLTPPDREACRESAPRVGAREYQLSKANTALENWPASVDSICAIQISETIGGASTHRREICNC